MRSIFDYDDYHELLLDAAAGLVLDVFGVSLYAHARLVNRVMLEDESFAILFCKDLIEALGLSGDSAMHLQRLMIKPQKAYVPVRS